MSVKPQTERLSSSPFLIVVRSFGLGKILDPCGFCGVAKAGEGGGELIHDEKYFSIFSCEKKNSERKTELQIEKEEVMAKPGYVLQLIRQSVQTLNCKFGWGINLYKCSLVINRGC